ncbi:hypothetical protein [Pseudobutyrivibrio sp.]|uniref:hypothetical protein n=1 Tax=Pseudobutyrivibrio sp. TaxID=2014367 RepID=UPI0038681180
MGGKDVLIHLHLLGFLNYSAVVANEIRDLADQSSAAAKNIQETMSVLAYESKETMENAGNDQGTVERQSEVIKIWFRSY